MVNIRIVYYENSEVLTKDIDHTDWNNLAPNTILKLYFQKTVDSWIEVSGKSAYAIYDIEGECYFGSIYQSTLSSISGKTKEISMETIVNSKPELKFGIEISNTEWNKVNSTVFV